MRRHIPASLVLLLALPAAADEPPSVPPAAAPAEPPGAPPSVPMAVPPPPPTAVPPGADSEPLAGYNGSFFLRDRHDWFVLFPKGRLQVDGYLFPAPGDAPLSGGMSPAPVPDNDSADNRPRNTIFIRRARVELQGTIVKHFDFHVAGEFGTAPGTGQYGTVADAYVIVDYSDYIKLQAGQFDAPFTLENRTSDKYFDFMERSLAVRAFGVPSNKEAGAMLWGYLPNKLVYYSAGWFDGSGQNLKTQDTRGAVIGRAFVAPAAPFARDRRWLQDVWVGGSIWYQPTANLGGESGVAPSASGAAQNDLPGMSTQGGWSFFSSSYKANFMDAMMNTPRSHLAQNGTTLKWAVEANVPLFKRYGLRFELVHDSIDLGRYDDVASTSKRSAVTSANLSGYGWYVEAWGWILGDDNYLETPGLELAPRLKRPFRSSDPTWGLQVVARYDHVGFSIDHNTTAAQMMAGLRDPAEGSYSVDSIALGVNAWATKHLRLTVNYVANYIGGDAANVTKNLYYQKFEHELLFRLGVNL